jgi:hypothetical protein
MSSFAFTFSAGVNVVLNLKEIVTIIELASYSRHLEKLMAAHLVKIFPAFFVVTRFATVLSLIYAIISDVNTYF